MVMNDQSLQSLYLARQELSTMGAQSDELLSIKDNPFLSVSKEHSLVFTE